MRRVEAHVARAFSRPSAARECGLTATKRAFLMRVDLKYKFSTIRMRGRKGFLLLPPHIQTLSLRNSEPYAAKHVSPTNSAFPGYIAVCEIRQISQARGLF